MARSRDLILSEFMKEFKDEYTLVSNDASNNGKSTWIVNGHVKIVDESGNTVLSKDNKIVLRGRVFALEKIFNMANTLNNGYANGNLEKKKVALFKVGKGGTVEGQPFNVLPVSNSDMRNLRQEIPFRLSADTDTQGYYDLKQIPGTDDFGYYAKKIDSIEWGKGIPEDITTNFVGLEDEVHLKLGLSIGTKDLFTTKDLDVNGNEYYKRNTFINELGLCIANPVKTESVDRMEDIELFSYLGFESEPFFKNSKYLSIIYYIFA